MGVRRQTSLLGDLVSTIYSSLSRTVSLALEVSSCVPKQLVGETVFAPVTK